MHLYMHDFRQHMAVHIISILERERAARSEKTHSLLDNRLEWS